VLDIVSGSLATLLAALCTMAIGRAGRESVGSKALACLPPVVFNGLIIGAVIAFESSASANVFWPAFLSNSLWVGFGEFVILFVLGLPALILLPRSSFFRTLAALYAKTN
jgi:hypothetical protein